MVKLDCGVCLTMVPAVKHGPKTDDGYPGVAIDGSGRPVYRKSPPVSYRVLFGDLLFEKSDNRIVAPSENPSGCIGCSPVSGTAYRRPVTEKSSIGFINMPGFFLKKLLSLSK